MAFDLNRGYRLNPAVSLRPEPFGALVYHFGNRRLSFLKTRQLVTVVRLLESHDSAADALAAAGVPVRQRAAYAAALARAGRFGGYRCALTRPACPASRHPDRAVQGRADRADLPDLGTYLCLQPAVRALPERVRAA